jgi:Ankyrin repeats (3 copies)
VDVRTALRSGDAEALRRILAADPAQANALVCYGDHCRKATHHPLHYISDLVFNGVLPEGKEMPLVEALLDAGSDVDFGKGDRHETNLIGAASLGAEDVGLRLLDAGADPHARGNGGETALHWAALLGEVRLVERLIEGADLELEDDQYHSTPLGWAVHGFCESQKDNPADHGDQRGVIALLVTSGAKVRPDWLQEDTVRADPAILNILQGKAC